jgi:hypothetical protein
VLLDDDALHYILFYPMKDGRKNTKMSGAKGKKKNRIQPDWPVSWPRLNLVILQDESNPSSHPENFS